MGNTTGLDLIKAERQRQIDSEGWSSAHDDEHGAEVMERAARCYRDASGPESLQPALWPWDAQWWKPKSRRRNLERAGALYQAAAETAERARDYSLRNGLLDQVQSCAVLLDSVMDAE